ncbi:MAG: hypothetical protein PHE51_04960 [Eubacteriales bacterium]|nr:hypothetical protein [Eubacteriales bacterium]
MNRLETISDFTNTGIVMTEHGEYTYTLTFTIIPKSIQSLFISPKGGGVVIKTITFSGYTISIVLFSNNAATRNIGFIVTAAG